MPGRNVGKAPLSWLKPAFSSFSAGSVARLHRHVAHKSVNNGTSSQSMMAFHTWIDHRWGGSARAPTPRARNDWLDICIKITILNTKFIIFNTEIHQLQCKSLPLRPRVATSTLIWIQNDVIWIHQIVGCCQSQRFELKSWAVCSANDL